MESFRLCLALGPLAMYLLVLGAIHLRRRPFLVTGGRDLAALGVAVSGLMLVGPIELLLPEQAIQVYRGYVWLLLLAMYGLCLSLVVLLARPRLVIYNISADELRPLLAQTIDALDPDARWAGASLLLPRLRVELHLESSELLRNVTLNSAGGQQSYSGWHRLEVALASRLASAESPASPWGLTLGAAALMLLTTLCWQLAVHPQAVTQGLREMLRL